MKKILIGTGLIILVFCAAPAMAAKWKVPSDFSTIQEAIDSPLVSAGDKIEVEAGSHAGALVTKAVKIVGKNGAVIDDGPAHSSGLIQGFRLLAGSDGCEISGLTFEVDLAIMNAEAVNDVSVHHCTFLDAIQAISNWRGSGWEIMHNEIYDLRTRNGGGIGILVGDYSGGVVQNNTISHNEISGVLHVYEADGGGYNGSGIVLYADFRWSRDGAAEISGNVIDHNKIDMVSDNPGVDPNVDPEPNHVDIVAIELTVAEPPDAVDPLAIMFGNEVSQNKYECTERQIDLTPDNLDEVNEIFKNSGKKKCN